ncbi:DUF1684 domain-containing protein [bacterium]|nr:DUF1684 domain-containing protein [bacterium]MBU1675625.1 DUF1684 domain-containing protein [bacterium]
MKRTHALWTIACLCSLAVVGGCGERAPGPVTMDDAEQEAWEIRLVEMRIDKNERFTDPEQTPLMEQDLPGFEGLNYYYPVPELRFRVPFVETAAADTVTLVKRQGESVRYLRKGHVAFKHEGSVYKLQAFGPVGAAPDGDYLWLPFYDETSGEETFGGGRYLDLEVDDEGIAELDFNFAYNPLCDYNHERYNCTLPPEENRLEIPVRAGEKLFRLEE